MISKNNNANAPELALHTAGVFCFSWLLDLSPQRSSSLRNKRLRDASTQLSIPVKEPRIFTSLEDSAYSIYSAFRDFCRQRDLRSLHKDFPGRNIGAEVISFIPFNQAQDLEPSNSVGKYEIDALSRFGKTSDDALRFPGHRDASFQQLAAIMNSALKDFRLIDAAYRGNDQELNDLMNEGYDVNSFDMRYPSYPSNV